MFKNNNFKYLQLILKSFDCMYNFVDRFELFNNNYINIIQSHIEIDYKISQEIMQNLVQEIKNTNIPGYIWILEHQDVYTAGTSSTEEQVNSIKSIPVYYTNRGGKYTFHGNGQIICYFIINLKFLYRNKKFDVRHYVRILESIVIRTLHNFDIKSFLKYDKVGIWVDTRDYNITKNDNIIQDLENKMFYENQNTFYQNTKINNNNEKGYHKKVSALGLRITNGISYHGFAINLNTDLSKYQNIIPCGISDYGICNIAEFNNKITKDRLISQIKTNIKYTFTNQNLWN